MREVGEGKEGSVVMACVDDIALVAREREVLQRGVDLMIEGAAVESYMDEYEKN